MGGKVASSEYLKKGTLQSNSNYTRKLINVAELISKVEIEQKREKRKTTIFSITSLILLASFTVLIVKL